MKSNHIRIFLLISLALMVLVLFGKWQKQQAHKAKPNSQSQSQVTQNAMGSNQAQNQKAMHKDSPELDLQQSDKPTHNEAKSAGIKTQSQPENQKQPANKQNLIHVQTDVYRLAIDPDNGSIVHLTLRQYPTSVNSEQKVNLLNNQSASYYIAQSGIISDVINNDRLAFKAQKGNYKLGDKNALSITLKAKTKQAIIKKTYLFKKNSYDISVRQSIKNLTDSPITARFYGQLKRKYRPKSYNIFDVQSFATYRGAILSSDKDNYQKQGYETIKQTPAQINTTEGWAALLQHYFVGAWVPVDSKEGQNTVYTQNLGNDQYAAGVAMPVFTVQPNKTYTESAQLYIGPTDKSRLEAVTPTLSLTVDYGWLWFISDILFWFLKLFYQLVGNWGVAIIMVTILIKILFYPLSAKSYRSMAKMRLLQPKIQQLKERYGNDRQKMSQKMMELYKQEKVNPLGGCLPMLVQIPVFIALYWVLLESVELRQAPFVLWIQDLSVKDPYFILPVLMGLSMFVQQKLNPPPPDPTQAKIMMFMPVVFTILFLNFPAGLVLYWLTNNILGILQQWYVMKQMDNKTKKNKPAVKRQPANQ